MRLIMLFIVVGNWGMKPPLLFALVTLYIYPRSLATSFSNIAGSSAGFSSLSVLARDDLKFSILPFYSGSRIHQPCYRASLVVLSPVAVTRQT